LFTPLSMEGNSCNYCANKDKQTLHSLIKIGLQGKLN